MATVAFEGDSGDEAKFDAALSGGRFTLEWSLERGSGGFAFDDTLPHRCSVTAKFRNVLIKTSGLAIKAGAEQGTCTVDFHVQNH